MATQYTNLKGVLKWAKVYDPDEAFGTKNWKVNLYFHDEKELEKFQRTGLQMGIKEDMDGKYITLRRPVQKLIRDDLVMFSPPEITGVVNVKYVNEDGEKVRQFNKGDKVKVIREGEPVLLGNGTVGIVNLSYYNTSKGFGHRLESIRVIDLVEYEGNASTPKKEPEEELPVPAKVKTKGKVSTEEALNDKLPW